MVLDAGIEEDLRTRHLQVVDAARASLGLSFVEYTVTDLPLMVRILSGNRVGVSVSSRILFIHYLGEELDMNDYRNHVFCNGLGTSNAVGKKFNRAKYMRISISLNCTVV